MGGLEGDTLASALLAQGVQIMGRSLKYHRPRGVLSAGVEEPNALVEAGSGPRREPNTRATDLFLYEGLSALSQNRWPSLEVDVGAVGQTLAPLIPAGFYYKTFLGGPKIWGLYEGPIRRAAGLGRPPRAREIDIFDHRAAFCDVLVVGSGPAGLAAGLAAARSGARVMLVEQDRRLGGGLLRDPAEIDERAGPDWAQSVADLITAQGGRVLMRATASGYHDHDLATVVERRVEAGQAPAPDTPAQRLWHVRARRVILAQGAFERPLLFSGNDRPGVMLAQAARTYVARFGVRPGSRAIVAGCDDSVYLTALALAEAEVEIAAVLDSRKAADGPLAKAASARFPIFCEAHIIRAEGNRGVSSARAAAAGRSLEFDADLIAMSGGVSAAVHLHMQAGGSLDWDEASGAFTPAQARQGQLSAGAGAGRRGLAQALLDGWRAGQSAAESLGYTPSDDPAPRGATALPGGEETGSAYGLPRGADPKTAFIDFQNDVTAADIDLARREGYRSVEHLKRYTTLGMGSDQGKTGALLGLARLAKAMGKSPAEVGLTTFRPPFTPVTLGALAGEAVGHRAMPHRRLALWREHDAADALWQPTGAWSRPRCYPALGETPAQAAQREARAVRAAVGLADISTLAKFEIAGPDALVFLERVCATPVASLAVGRGRYTVMLREDGIVADDGTVWRLAPDRYFLTSSTGGAETMAHRLSYLRHGLAPELRVSVTPVQERWTAIVLAGPKARGLLSGLLGQAPPGHMASHWARLHGAAALVLGASYSGERAFEIYAPAFAAVPLWRQLMILVEGEGGGPYGLDAMDLLRIEKGHIRTGAEIDGRLSPFDLGLGRLLRKGGFIGWAGLQRPEFNRPDRLRLVGLEGLDGVLPEGAMILPDLGAAPQGHVSSAGRRILSEGAIGLGLVAGGPDRLGEVMIAHSPTRGLTGRVRLCPPMFHDPEGRAFVDA
jgi:sarcosine oxidase subunit alpha